jgi:hypothetical protein
MLQIATNPTVINAKLEIACEFRAQSWNLRASVDFEGRESEPHTSPVATEEQTEPERFSTVHSLRYFETAKFCTSAVNSRNS